VIYLLDINVLLALAYWDHSLHRRADAWLTGLQELDPSVRPATCSITELGFVRIACGGARLAQNVSAAQAALKRVKKERLFTFLDDGLDADRLPRWVEKPKHVTDGHLLQLATGHRATLATLDEGIPGAFLIPQEPGGPLFVREPPTRYGIAA
jgi:predicted nucleic acid-binding protein